MSKSVEDAVEILEDGRLILDSRILDRFIKGAPRKMKELSEAVGAYLGLAIGKGSTVPTVILSDLIHACDHFVEQ